MKFRLRLVDDWHDAWRWSSVRLIALSGVIQTVLIAFPQKMAEYVPYWIMQTLATTSLVILFLAGIGRITKVEKPNDQPPITPVGSGDHGE